MLAEFKTEIRDVEDVERAGDVEDCKMFKLQIQERVGGSAQRARAVGRKHKERVVGAEHAERHGGLQNRDPRC